MLPQYKCFKIIRFRIILEGRIACLEINIDDTMISIINVYFPTKDKQAEQLTAISKLELDLNNNSPEALIIGRDLNLYINSLLGKYNGKETDLSQACKMLRNLLNEYDLVDIWRTKNPNIHHYTWRRNNPLMQARLDYWIISISLTYNVTECKIKPSIKSDHSLISLTILSNLNAKKGPGLWKFNAALLQNNDYVEMLRDKLNYWNHKYKDMYDKNTK